MPLFCLLLLFAYFLLCFFEKNKRKEFCSNQNFIDTFKISANKALRFTFYKTKKDVHRRNTHIY